MLRVTQALDPRSPRFEDAGLRSKGGGEVQAKGGYIEQIADAAAKWEIGIEV